MSREYKSISKPKINACVKQKESSDIKIFFKDISYHTRHLKRSIRVEDPFTLLGINWAPEDYEELKLAAYPSL